MFVLLNSRFYVLLLVLFLARMGCSVKGLEFVQGDGRLHLPSKITSLILCPGLFRFDCL
jgi:hypothetical protein